MALFDELSGLLTGGPTLSKLGSLTGGNAAATQKAVEGGVPLLLGALGKGASRPGGAEALFNLIKADNGGLLDNIGGFLDGGDKGGIGGQLIGGLLGKRRGAVEQGLAQHAGLPLGGIAKLLPMLAPLVMGFLGKKRAATGMDQAAFTRLLSDERAGMEKAGHGNLLGLLDGHDDDDHRGFLDGFTKLAGLGGLAAAGGGIAAAGAGLGKLGLDKVTGAAGTVTDKMSGAAGTVTDKMSGVAGKATDRVGSTVTSATAGAGAVGAAAKGGAVNAGRTVAGAVPTIDVKKKRPIWWWLLPLAILLALGAWGLSQCGGDSKETTDTVAATETTVADTTAAETTVAETTVAETTVAETAAADTAAAETAAADTAAAPAETEAAVADTAAADTAAAETVAADTAAADTAAAETAAPAESTPAAPTGVVAAALSDPNLSTLAQTISLAGLGDTLQGAGPFTVFAPTDDAFAALPDGVLDALVKPENKETLAKILTYHVVPGNVKAAAVVTGPVASVEGSELALKNEGGVVTVNGAKVLTADVSASNGTIHTIDKVLVPASVDLSALVPVATEETTPAAEAPAESTAPAAATKDYVVYFATSSANINATGRGTIAEAVATLKAAGSGPVALVGHADVRGNKDANLDLSKRRVAAVEAALKAALGADADKFTFTTNAEGDSQPEADLAKSRRVTIKIG